MTFVQGAAASIVVGMALSCVHGHIVHTKFGIEREKVATIMWHSVTVYALVNVLLALIFEDFNPNIMETNRIEIMVASFSALITVGMDWLDALRSRKIPPIPS